MGSYTRQAHGRVDDQDAGWKGGVWYPNTYKGGPQTKALLLALGADPQAGRRRPIDFPLTESGPNCRVSDLEQMVEFDDEGPVVQHVGKARREHLRAALVRVDDEQLAAGRVLPAQPQVGADRVAA